MKVLVGILNQEKVIVKSSQNIVYPPFEALLARWLCPCWPLIHHRHCLGIKEHGHTANIAPWSPIWAAPCQQGNVIKMLHITSSNMYTLSYMLVLTCSSWYMLQVLTCSQCYMLQVPDNIPPAGPRGDNILLEEGGLTFAPLTCDVLGCGQCRDSVETVWGFDPSDRQGRWPVTGQVVRCKSVVCYSIVAAICSSPPTFDPATRQPRVNVFIMQFRSALLLSARIQHRFTNIKTQVVQTKQRYLHTHILFCLLQLFDRIINTS